MQMQGSPNRNASKLFFRFSYPCISSLLRNAAPLNGEGERAQAPSCSAIRLPPSESFERVHRKTDLAQRRRERREVGHRSTQIIADGCLKSIWGSSLAILTSKLVRPARRKLHRSQSEALRPVRCPDFKQENQRRSRSRSIGYVGRF